MLDLEALRAPSTRRGRPCSPLRSSRRSRWTGRIGWGRCARQDAALRRRVVFLVGGSGRARGGYRRLGERSDPDEGYGVARVSGRSPRGRAGGRVVQSGDKRAALSPGVSRCQVSRAAELGPEPLRGARPRRRHNGGSAGRALPTWLDDRHRIKLERHEDGAGRAQRRVSAAQKTCRAAPAPSTGSRRLQQGGARRRRGRAEGTMDRGRSEAPPRPERRPAEVGPGCGRGETEAGERGRRSEGEVRPRAGCGEVAARRRKGSG